MQIPTKSIINWRMCDKEKPPDSFALVVMMENMDIWQGYLRSGTWFDSEGKKFGLKIVAWAFQRDITAYKEEKAWDDP